jgi:hypothetical protein
MDDRQTVLPITHSFWAHVQKKVLIKQNKDGHFIDQRKHVILISHQPKVICIWRLPPLLSSPITQMFSLHMNIDSK